LSVARVSDQELRQAAIHLQTARTGASGNRLNANVSYLQDANLALRCEPFSLQGMVMRSLVLHTSIAGALLWWLLATVSH
jgi:hypothetical protein